MLTQALKLKYDAEGAIKQGIQDALAVLELIGSLKLVSK